MKFYIVSDTHGFFSETERALREKGFFDDTKPHKLILCGDMMDRGEEAVKMQDFMADLLHKNELIFIRGNHEDLLIDMVSKYERYELDIITGHSHHVSNGTFDTALQLSGMSEKNALHNKAEFLFKIENSVFYKELIPASINYFETKNYLFIHGYIPCTTDSLPPWYRDRTYKYREDWRSADDLSWDTARWINGMQASEILKIKEPNKTIVCGHWHASFGHSVIGKKCSEFDEDAIFTPYYGDKVIGIDACTPHTGFVNCVVLEDDEI